MVEEDRLNLHPGGHGAIWKTAEEEGVFRWFLDQGKTKLLIRQINNPIAGVDHGLLSLIGVGKRGGKTFGFASCKRVVHAAEGVLVEVEEESGEKAISNIEYTHFSQYGIEDKPSDDGYSPYPTNTNILYVDLPKLMAMIQQKPLPALYINMKNKVPFISETGERSEIKGGRLESMMQNISDRLTTHRDGTLPTFVTYNERLKTISVTKKCAKKGESLLETPEGAFQDLMRNGYDLLKNHCQMKLSSSTLFLYHPSLGPLYEIISQKIWGGEINEGGELQLEIAELFLDYLTLEGSLLIEAKNPCGHLEGRTLRYSDRCGKCRLRNVTVRNRGIDREAENVYWKNQISRHETLKIVLLGSGEFEAEEATFVGDQTIVVPDGERWTVRGDEITKELIDGPTWKWSYRWDEEQIRLEQQSACHMPALQGR